MLKPMLRPSNPLPTYTIAMVCGGVPVTARAMGANMITTIMNTAA
jgi:hypothetical protein